jgi:hypothetical protein
MAPAVGYWIAGVRNVKTAHRPGQVRTAYAPSLSESFGNLDAGRVLRSGYIFEICCPVSTEWRRAAHGCHPAVDAARAEVLWAVCLAERFRQPGKRAFFTNQNGDILHCSNTATLQRRGQRAAGAAVLRASANNTSMGPPWP